MRETFYSREYNVNAALRQTAYTKEHPKHTSTWLCVECCYALGIDPFEKPKKAKAKPAKKEERGKVTHYEVRKGASTLASVCIQVRGVH